MNFRPMILGLLGVLACGGSLGAADAPSVSIAAASDLVFCLEELNRGFNHSHPGVTLKTSTGSSGNFFAQIRNGAPFDLFLSADMSYPKELIKAGAAEESSLIQYAIGRLALWTVKTNLALEECLAEAEILGARHRHFELFWFPHTDRVAVKTLDETAAPPETSVAKRILVDLLFENAAFWLVSEACRLRPSWSPAVSRLCARVISEGERVDASHRIFPSPRLVRFNEMEYAVPAEQGPDCLREIREVFTREGGHVHFPVEYRYVAADDIWLSPFYGRDSAVISVHTYRGMPFAAFFDAAEAVFRNHNGRPHWGKCHRRKGAELAALYPRWEDFRSLRRRLDPRGVFLTPYLREIFDEPLSGS